MLLLVVIGQFVITPMVAELRVQGLTDTPRFGQLHGIASVLFIANESFWAWCWSLRAGKLRASRVGQALSLRCFSR